MAITSKAPYGFMLQNQDAKDIGQVFWTEVPEWGGILWLDETPSTNSRLREMASEGAPHGLILATHSQTAGRGQRGNHWEAEPGKNLTFSMLLRPRRLRPAEQFCLSQAIALGVVAALKRRVPNPHAVTVKWPNDIYVGDRKICGILIEHSLGGETTEEGGGISFTIAGVGLNVNQRRFLSDAPNPVSLIQLTGEETLLEPLLTELGQEIADRVRLVDSGRPLALMQEFRENLWRRDGYFPYRRTADGREFLGRIVDIAPTGHITLATPEGEQLAFAFKEVEAILD